VSPPQHHSEAVPAGRRKDVPAIEVLGISKAFGGVKALVDVNLQIEAGEIHALLGGNGAGKSTLLKVLDGVHEPDAGSIFVFGQRVDNFNPALAKETGIAMIFQEMSLIPTLTVAQNVFLTRESRTGFGLIDDRAAERRASGLFDMLGVDVDPTALVGDLGAGQQQLTEIAKAISKDARVLILDEPSSALSTSEVEHLFEFLRRLKADDHAIIYVSHRMDEISRIADRATILRDGRHVITAPLSELPIETMIKHIVGTQSRGFSDVVREHHATDLPLLELKNLSGEHKPVNINLTVHQGEVVGLAGLLGSGRSSLARVIAGIDPIREGEVFVNGEPVSIRRPHHAIRAGMVLVPEDRLRQGVIAAQSVAQNLTLAVLEQISTRTIVSNNAVEKLADEQIHSLKIKTASLNHAVQTLSGGNQQKVVIGKWLSAYPDILILDEPTAGIDIGSKAEIIQLIRELAKAGKAILMISSELSELLTACDRLVIMSHGRICGDVAREDLDNADDGLNVADIDEDPLKKLQAAEQRLQFLIQNALTMDASPGERNVD